MRLKKNPIWWSSWQETCPRQSWMFLHTCIDMSGPKWFIVLCVRRMSGLEWSGWNTQRTVTLLKFDFMKIVGAKLFQCLVFYIVNPKCVVCILRTRDFMNVRIGCHRQRWILDYFSVSVCMEKAANFRHFKVSQLTVWVEHHQNKSSKEKKRKIFANRNKIWATKKNMKNDVMQKQKIASVAKVVEWTS